MFGSLANHSTFSFECTTPWTVCHQGSVSHKSGPKCNKMAAMANTEPTVSRCPSCSTMPKMRLLQLQRPKKQPGWLVTAPSGSSVSASNAQIGDRTFTSLQTSATEGMNLRCRWSKDRRRASCLQHRGQCLQEESLPRLHHARSSSRAGTRTALGAFLDLLSPAAAWLMHKASCMLGAEQHTVRQWQRLACAAFRHDSRRPSASL